MNGVDLCMSCMQPMNGYTVCAHCGWQKGSEQSDPCQLPMGTVLAGRYIVGKSLGVGGFGITYVAWDDTLKQKIAIKEYYPAGLASRIPGETDVVVFSGNKRDQYIAGLQRFLAEARNMAKFSNDPNIVNVIDFFEANNTAYIAMEFLDGITLKEYLKTCGGTVPCDVALQIIKPVSDALSHMHAQGIIHRDVSPDNIMITSSNVIKLIDFGAARLSLGEKEETLSVMLKPGYAPPEQYRTKSRQGSFTDVYALGATYYRMITGKMPPESTDRTIEDDMAAPSTIDPSIPENVDRAVMRAMALDSTVRFKTTDQFIEALSGSQVVQYPQELVKRRRIRNILLVVGASLAAIAACVGIFLMASKKSGVKPEDLTVWVPVVNVKNVQVEAGDPAEKNIYAELFETAEEAFIKDYPKMRVTVEEIPADEYEARLAEAAAQGRLPDVFAMTVFNEESLKANAIDTAPAMIDNEAVLAGIYDVSPVVAELNTAINSYYLLYDYSMKDRGKLLPTAFRMPIMFVNYATEGIELAKLNECADITALNDYVENTLGAGWSITRRAADCILEDCSEEEAAVINAHIAGEGYNAFVEGENEAVLIGLSSDIKWANKRITVKMQCVPGHEYCVQLTGFWAVGDSRSDNRNKAASLLALKLLNGAVQENISADTACFPLESEQCGKLFDISQITLGLPASPDDPKTYMGRAKAVKTAA